MSHNLCVRIIKKFSVMPIYSVDLERYMLSKTSILSAGNNQRSTYEIEEAEQQ